MDFRFTKEQETFRKEVREFCEKEPWGEILDRKVAVNYSPEYYHKVCAKGWIGLPWPEEYGGQARDFIDSAIFHEEMAYSLAPMALNTYGTTVWTCGNIIFKHGSEQMKRHLLPKITRGEILIGEAVTEPNAGQDLSMIETRAVFDGDDYIINGQKMFITHAHKAELGFLFMLMARTNFDAPKEKGLSLFIVDFRSPGITIRPLWTMSGYRTNEVFFDDVRVPKSNLIGEENRGLDYFRENIIYVWDRSPGDVAGWSRRCLEMLIRYVKKNRSKNGELLCKDPLIRQKLAQMATKAELVRLCTYRIEWMKDKGFPVISEKLKCELFRHEFMMWFANTALQILGRYGQLLGGSKHNLFGGMFATFYLDWPVWRFTGASEVLRNEIAATVLGMPRL